MKNGITLDDRNELLLVIVLCIPMVVLTLNTPTA